MSPITPTTPRRADAIANRDALVLAAGDLYAARGLDVSYDEISRAAGVGRATLYRHFPTRERLYDAVLDRVVAQIEEAAAALPASPNAFARLVRTALRIQTDHLVLFELLPARSATDDGAVRRRARMVEVFRTPLARAQEAGLVPGGVTPEDVRIQLLMLSAVVRPDMAKADRRRAWNLARRALGIDDARDD